MLSLYSQFLAGPDHGKGDGVGAVVGRGVVDHGGASAPLHALMRFGPGWQFKCFLAPLYDRSLVTPFEQTRHHAAMHSRQHEKAQRLLTFPKGARPESIPSVAKHRDSEAV